MMRYWFVMFGTMSREVELDLWRQIEPYNSNMTVLFDRTFVYGSGDDSVVRIVGDLLAGTGLPVERR